MSASTSQQIVALHNGIAETNGATDHPESNATPIANNAVVHCFYNTDNATVTAPEVKPLEYAFAQLQRAKKLYVDTEGHMLGCRGGKLRLIQLGMRRGKQGIDIYVIDVLKLNREDLDPFKSLMINKNVVKIFWDCRADMAQLRNEYKIIVFPVEDLQIKQAYIDHKKHIDAHEEFCLMKLKGLKNVMKEKMYKFKTEVHNAIIDMLDSGKRLKYFEF